MRDLAKLLYTHNPFYLISAGSVLFGLRTAFDNSQAATQSAWMLAGSLAGYTLLLAATAIIIVRIGKVWDDARTIALLVLLMLVAISSSFDRLCIDDRTASQMLLLMGCLFAVVVVESLIRGLSVRLPWSYRLPLYLLLGLFFVYPLAVSSAWWQNSVITAPWRVIAFPLSASLVLLTLIPAIRMGSAVVANNGSPWQWPWYPWSVFFFMAVGIVGRSYLLTMSFQTDAGTQSTFGGYYLVPLGLCISILVAEVGFAEKFRGLQSGLIAGPWLLMLVSLIPGNGVAYDRFLNEFSMTIGSPLWCTAILGLLYCGYLRLRGVPNALPGAMALLIAMTFIDSNDPQWRGLAPQHWWPLAVVAVYHLVLLKKEPMAWRFLKGWCSAVAAFVIHGQNTDMVQHYGVIPLHLLLAGVMFAAWCFRDSLAVWLRTRLSVGVIILCVGAAVAGWMKQDWRTLSYLYASSLGLICIAWWYVHGLRLWKWASVACFAALCVPLLASSAQNWHVPSRSVQALLIGAGSFILGGSISAAKAGFTHGISGRIARERERLLSEWNSA